jgi:hypothetical protein
VFPDAPSAFDEVGQDWRQWITNGLVDFLCPMDYTTALSYFTNFVAQQLTYAAGHIPVYPGIGAYLLEPDGFLAQLQETRAAHTGGFNVFELSPDAVTNLLPAVRAGATAPDEPDVDNDLLPDSWELRWFGNLSTAGRNTDSDGDGLSDYEEYVLGTDPTQPNPGLTLQGRLAGGAFEVSFLGQAAEGPGYQNAERHYGLESSAHLPGGGSWVPVPGSADQSVASGSETVVFSISPVPTNSTFFRVRVWLQQRE